jgi:hypothetical protein
LPRRIWRQLDTADRYDRVAEDDSQLLLAVPSIDRGGEVLAGETTSVPIRRVIRRLAVA